MTEPGDPNVASLVVGILSTFGPNPMDVTLDADLDDLDLDSLDLVEVLQILEDDHGLLVDSRLLAEAQPRTVGDVVNAISRLARPAP